RAEVFDAAGNRIARLGGASRHAGDDRVATVLAPDEETATITLEPACIESDCSGTWKRTLDRTLSLSAGVTVKWSSPAALAALDVSGSRDLLVGVPGAALPAGSPASGSPARPNAGAVAVFTSSDLRST